MENKDLKIGNSLFNKELGEVSVVGIGKEHIICFNKYSCSFGMFVLLKELYPIEITE